MRKVVLSASVKMEEEIAQWLAYWNAQSDVVVIDYPERIAMEDFLQEYRNVFCAYFDHLDEADVLFVVNGTKEGVKGYIGAGMFSEIAYVVSQIARGTQKYVFLAHPPAAGLFCSDELDLWMQLGWVKVFALSS